MYAWNDQFRHGGEATGDPGPDGGAPESDLCSGHCLLLGRRHCGSQHDDGTVAQIMRVHLEFQATQVNVRVFGGERDRVHRSIIHAPQIPCGRCVLHGERSQIVIVRIPDYGDAQYPFGAEIVHHAKN